MTLQTLQRETEELRRKLTEAEEALAAIRSGQIDAIVIEGDGGPQIFSLTGAETVYRLAVETMAEGAVNVTLEGRILFCNAQFAQFVATPMEHIIGRDISEFLTVEDGAACRTLFEQCLREPTSTRVVLLGPGERRTPVRLTGVPLVQPGGVSICLVAADLSELESTAHQMAELQRVREQLQASEGRLKLFIEHAPAGIAMFDRDMRYLAASQRWKEDYGLTENLEGRSHYEVPEIPIRWKDIHRRCLAGETIKANEDPFVRANGSAQWTKWEARPWHQTDGSIGGILIGAEDITERIEDQQKLRESDNRLRLALEAGQMGAWDVDLRTKATRWDAKEFALLGCSPESVEPSPREFYRRVHPDDREAVERAVEDALLSGRLLAEFRVVHPDGKARWLAAAGRILRDETGRPMRMVGLNYDITERKLTEQRLHSFTHRLEHLVDERTQELVQSQERLRALATELNLAEQRERKRLANELHDHLQQMLVFGKLQLGQSKRHAAAVPACASVMQQIDDLLSDALIYTRTLVAELSPPVLREHGLAAGLRWLAEYMKKHGQTVTVIAPEGSDRKLPEDQMILLFQSVRELLINSSKHAGTGQVTVMMEQLDCNLRVEVRDEGAGFDPASVTAAGSSPVGVLSSKFGLLSIRERMRALGGSFHIDSEPGKGTRATLILPMPVDELLRARTQELATTYIAPDTEGPFRTARKRSKTMQVLLVDNHAIVREGLKVVLQSYEDVAIVGEAWNGAEAVAAAERLRPQIIVMDISMPEMNGIEATARIKARFPEIVVIGLSVNADEDNREAMTRAGAAALLTKETAVDQLYHAIQQAVEPPGRR